MYVPFTSLTLVGPINVHKHFAQEENKMNCEKKQQSCEPKEAEPKKNNPESWHGHCDRIQTRYFMNYAFLVYTCMFFSISH